MSDDATAKQDPTWKDIDAGWTPKLESWRCSQKAIGFEVSMMYA